MLQQMTNKISRVLMAVGISFCLLGAMYMMYIAVVKWTIATIEASGAKTMTVAGVVSLTEGEVIRADDECTIIQYYSEWDGTDYKKVIAHANTDYSVNSKVPVVDVLGMGPGSCLVAGSYKKHILFLSMMAFILFALGFILYLKRKEIDKWQEEKS